jgi:hypothetical protein
MLAPMPDDEGPSKKQRIHNVLRVAPNLSLASVSNVITALGVSAVSSTSTLGRMREEKVNISTPYGKLIVWLELELEKGGFLKWPVGNPMAIFYQLCKENINFAYLVKNSKKGNGVYNVALYDDEATPGNSQHFEVPKESQCFYWTLQELPDWFRCRDAGWWYIGVMRTSDQDRIKGGLSGVLRQVMRLFWPERGLNIRVGMRLPLGNGDSFLLQAKVGAGIKDESAIKYSWSVKGASGVRCCLLCKNVLKCDPSKLEGDSYCKHVARALPDSFDPQTDAEFWEACDMIETEYLSWQAGNTTKGAFKKLQIRLGITYDPDSLVYDRYLRGIIGPSSVLFDWMHSLLASGGMAQFEVNAFLLELLAQCPDMTLEKLDDFAAEVVWSPGLPRLARHFFEKRVVHKEGAHIRAFAAEMTMAIRVLGYFAETMLLPRRLMQEQCDCLLMLQKIVDMFGQGDAIVERTGELEEAIVKHHEKALEVYGAMILKVKPHLLMHIPKQIAYHGVNLSCFPGERKHRFTKACAEACFGAHFHLSVLRKCVAADLEEMRVSRCLHTYLMEPVCDAPNLTPILGAIFGQGPTNAAPLASRSIQTRIGKVCYGELLLFTSGGGTSIGVSQFFAKCYGLGGAEFHAVCIAECVRVSSKEWVTSENVTFADVATLAEKLPYAQSGGKLVPLFPTTVRNLLF